MKTAQHLMTGKDALSPTIPRHILASIFLEEGIRISEVNLMNKLGLWLHKEENPKLETPDGLLPLIRRYQLMTLNNEPLERTLITETIFTPSYWAVDIKGVTKSTNAVSLCMTPTSAVNTALWRNLSLPGAIVRNLVDTKFVAYPKLLRTFAQVMFTVEGDFGTWTKIIPSDFWITP